MTSAFRARELALAGLGIAYVFESLVHADLAEARLVELLPPLP